MTRKVVTPANVAPSKNPLSAAIVSGNLVFVSGQTVAAAQGIEAQTRAVLDRLGAVLRAAGSDYGRVLRCGIYLKDAASFAAMNEVYKTYFPTEPPARTTIISGLADPAVLVEIDCVAEVS